MRGAILMSVAALFFGLARVSEAITCTTADTCKKSTSMKGTCTAQKCECETSYAVGPYGCQKKQKAVITADFTKDVEVGATATLTCSAGEGPYKWFKDTVEVTTETGRVLTIDTNTAVAKVSYACEAKLTGIQSDRSADFDVQILSNADAIQIKLEVKGVTPKMVEGTKIKFTCDTKVKYASQVYVWTHDVNTVGTSSDTYVHTVEEAKDKGKKIKCSVGGVDSAEVPFPVGTFEADIDGVEISNAGPITLQVGQSVDLECQQTGDFPEPDTSDSLIKFKWQKEGADIPGENKRTLSITSATAETAKKYTCTAAVGTNPIKTSADVAVTVSDSLATKAIKPSAKVLYQEKYISLTCEHDNKNTKTVTYKWLKGDVELPSVTDNILQVNPATTDFNGDYKCQVSEASEGTSTSAAFTVKLEDPVTVNIKVNNVVVTELKPVTGTKVTMLCDVTKPTGAGAATFKWMNGGIDVPSETSKNYEITAGAILKITCEATVDSETTTSAAVTVTPQVGVNIKVNNVVVTELKPVTGTKVTMLCDVTKPTGAGAATFKWMNGGTDVPSETSKNYEITAGAILKITCEATVDSETTTSAAVTVTPQAKPVTPVLTVDQTSPVTIGQKVVMSCDSDSYDNGATFEWYKDNTVIKDATNVKYTIEKVTKADDGVYTCKTKILTKTSDVSNSETLSTVADGKTCTTKTDCDEPNMDKTVCNNNRCSCLPSFKWDGKQCSGAAAVMGSLLMIVCAIFARRIF